MILLQFWYHFALILKWWYNLDLKNAIILLWFCQKIWYNFNTILIKMFAIILKLFLLQFCQDFDTIFIWFCHNIDKILIQFCHDFNMILSQFWWDFCHKCTLILTWSWYYFVTFCHSIFYRILQWFWDAFGTILPCFCHNFDKNLPHFYIFKSFLSWCMYFCKATLWPHPLLKSLYK